MFHSNYVYDCIKNQRKVIVVNLNINVSFKILLNMSTLVIRMSFMSNFNFKLCFRTFWWREVRNCLILNIGGS